LSGLSEAQPRTAGQGLRRAFPFFLHVAYGDVQKEKRKFFGGAPEPLHPPLIPPPQEQGYLNSYHFSTGFDMTLARILLGE